MLIKNYKNYIVGLVYSLFLLVSIALSLPAFDFFSTAHQKSELAQIDASISIDELIGNETIGWKTVRNGYQAFYEKDKVIWTKLRLTNEGQSKDWAIGNLFSAYKSIDYFIQRSDGSIDKIAVNKSVRHFIPQALFKLEKNESVSVYSRIDFDPYWMVDIRVLPEASFLRNIKILMIISAFYVGAILILALGGLCSYVSLKDKSYLYFFSQNFLLASFYLLIDGNYINFFDLPFHTSSILFRIFWTIGLFCCLSFIYFIKSFLFISENRIIKVYTLFTFISIFLLYLVGAENCIRLIILNIFATNLITAHFMIPLIKVSKVREIWLGIAGVFVTLMISTAALMGLIDQTTFNIRLYCLGNIWMGLCFYLALSKRVYTLHEEKQTLSSILSGTIPRTALNEIINRPYGVSYNFREQTVSILFVDIVGFSLSSEKLGASESFQSLSKWLNKIQQIIEKTGGHIDRSLGDGFLCFFVFL